MTPSRVDQQRGACGRYNAFTGVAAIGSTYARYHYRAEDKTTTTTTSTKLHVWIASVGTKHLLFGMVTQLQPPERDNYSQPRVYTLRRLRYSLACFTLQCCHDNEDL